MSYLTYPLNYIDYDASDAETWLCTRNSGIFYANDFSPSVTGGDIAITIGEGLAWIHNHRWAGKAFKNDSPVRLELDVADAILNRIDVVAIQFSSINNETTIIVKRGTAANNPVIPSIVQSESLYELYICSIYRSAGSTTVGSGDITDLRLNSDYCGIMADSVTRVDTSAIQAQIDSLIKTYAEKIKSIETGSEMMLKSTYDTNGDGVVDDAERLGGEPPSSFVKTTDTIPVARGGTGTSSHTNNSVLLGNGTGAIKGLATSSGAMYATTTSGSPVFGVLPVSLGGTGATTSSAARAKLGIPSISFGSSAPSGGNNGDIYFQYL